MIRSRLLSRSLVEIFLEYQRMISHITNSVVRSTSFEGDDTSGSWHSRRQIEI